ncbi:hypothetical protein PRN20_01945 [Devosia sp. ZB163]|uniref:hypothetical protein n=1 Tax=Devosia sp. ZB163 TaxID=3025938 RepID=UPI002360F4F8|nr:hypothetical protein [Devosia sp. ZB163]MDC9822481.1 hypothetical protein [Devosia sp. ZB163]
MDATRTIMAVGAMGAGAAFLLALPDMLPPAVAGEEPIRTLLSTPGELWPPAFDPDKLMKWDYYVEPGVASEAVADTTIRKIGYGRTTYVSVMETASGTYSTDGLASPNVEYPGITKEPKPGAPQLLWLWGGGRWGTAMAFSGSSFLSIAPLDGGALVVTEDGTCVVRKDSIYC